jgi:hypothetical protein
MSKLSKENKFKPVVKVEKRDGMYVVRFSIGVQTFTLVEVCDSSDAKWTARMLRIAFRNIKSGK